MHRRLERAVCRDIYLIALLPRPYLMLGVTVPILLLMTDARPTIQDGETMVAFFARLDAWKEQGDWFPANGGTEQPFTTRTGHRLLYCYQPRSGRHGYLNMGTDMMIPDGEIHLYIEGK